MIYFDNAASSWPKPKQVITEMQNFLEKYAANPGRSGHRLAREAGRKVLEARQRLARFINCSQTERIVFTANATEALNMAIYGILESGDHVITTAMEHNSVLRPLRQLGRLGVFVDILSCDGNGLIDPQLIKKALRPNTKMIVINHASNVTGTVQPVEEIGKIAREAGIIFLLDAAQTAGAYPIDVQKLQVDLVAFTGHKSLYGPQGTGALYVAPDILLRPLKYGGTGSYSELDTQPEEYPDYLESGTVNGVGLAGLAAGLKYIEERGLTNIMEHERRLMTRLIKGLQEIDCVHIYGHRDVAAVPVLSFNIEGCDPSEIGFILDQVYDIAVRPGLHCAPLAHKTLGTFPEGTVRVSLSVFNSEEEIDKFLNAIEQISRDMALN
ncbi:MAG: aminotransferase class V-fold PLP-dependent enzyme [Thermoanaerobacteraceae bacterium]|nr:aminotransferase class V-fold PLP-dependent enzyme [Thermoanaerobacteraceae bacterium]